MIRQRWVNAATAAFGGLLLTLLPLAALAQDWLAQERDLAALHLPAGTIDGEIDQKSIQAMQMFQYSFGFPIRNRLTADQRATLARAARAAQAITPIVFEEEREVWQTREQSFLRGDFRWFRRQVYANGPDFMARRTALPYHPENRDAPNEMFTVNTQRVAAYGEHALTIVNASQDPLAGAVYLLAQALREDTGVAETLRAMQIVVPLAEKTPQETALIALLTVAAQYRLEFDEGCRSLEEAATLTDLLTRAIMVARQSTMDPVEWSSLVLRAIECAPAGERDGLFALRYEHARAISDHALREVLIAWARDADTRGAETQARDAYAEAVGFFRVRAAGDTDPTTTELIPPADAVAMQRLGLTAEARRLAEAHTGYLLTRPALPDAAARVLQQNYYWQELQTALMLLDMSQAALLKKLGRHFTPAREGADPTILRGDWQMAQVGLRHLKQTEEFSRLVRVGRGILPHVAASDDPKALMIVNLLVSEAAADLGDFELAEAHLTDVQRIAATYNLRLLIEGRVTAIQEKLSVFRLASLPAAERMLRQLGEYYGTDCKGAPARQGKSEWPYPQIDFAGISPAPAFRDAILNSDLMERLIACHPASKGVRALPRHQARAFCAVAALNGRSDLVESVLQAKNLKTPDLDSAIWCIHGLTDVGITQWMGRAGYMTESHSLADLYNLMIAPRADRTAFLGQFDPQVLPEPQLNDLPWIALELDRPQDHRVRLLKQTRETFNGSFGNIGPSQADYDDAYLAGLGLQKLGMFNTAEALFYLDDRVDPLAFGTETPAQLAADLLDIRAVDKRLVYARLFREAGQYDRARAAIGPLVELAVERLSSTDDPLPGTVEQWSDRLAPAFEQYLILQFDPGGSGPNYHSLFLVQQFIQAAQSTASLSVIEQRVNSSVPVAAREFQDARRILRAVMRDPNATLDAIDNATQKLRQAEATLARDDAALESHQIGVIRTLKDASAALRPGEAMLVVTQIESALIQTVLTRTAVQARKLDLFRHDAIAQVRAFRASITESRAGADRFDQRAARALYDDMIGWALGRQVPRRLRIVADSPWATLPFGALKSGDGWLAQTTALRLSPSVARSVLDAAPGPRGRDPGAGDDPGGGGTFLGIGDPVLANYHRRPGVPKDARLAELPETHNELIFMASVFSASIADDVFTGARATEAKLRELNATDRLSRARVVVLATHGLLSRDAVGIGAAALVLSDPSTEGEDGFLSAPEIYSYRIGADLVILSACNTGVSEAASGLSDLASAFFYAGANGLLLTHWEIDSGAATELMRLFALNFKPGQGTPDDSVRDAINALLSDPFLARFHHPRFWASHFVIA